MSICKRCGDQIGWKRDGAKWVPWNDAENVAHKCTTAPRRQRETIAGPRIVGADYTPACSGCTVPPWEVCACSAQLAA